MSRSFPPNQITLPLGRFAPEARYSTVTGFDVFGAPHFRMRDLPFEGPCPAPLSVRRAPE